MKVMEDKADQVTKKRKLNEADKLFKLTGLPNLQLLWRRMRSTTRRAAPPPSPRTTLHRKAEQRDSLAYVSMSMSAILLQLLKVLTFSSRRKRHIDYMTKKGLTPAKV